MRPRRSFGVGIDDHIVFIHPDSNPIANLGLGQRIRLDAHGAPGRSDHDETGSHLGDDSAYFRRPNLVIGTHLSRRDSNKTGHGQAVPHKRCS